MLLKSVIAGFVALNKKIHQDSDSMEEDGGDVGSNVKEGMKQLEGLFEGDDFTQLVRLFATDSYTTSTPSVPSSLSADSSKSDGVVVEYACSASGDANHELVGMLTLLKML